MNAEQLIKHLSKIDDDQKTIVILDRTTGMTYPIEEVRDVDGQICLLIDVEE